MNEDKEMGESVKGAYSYMGDDGKEYSIKYTADENGFRPVSKNFHFKILDKCALVNTSLFIRCIMLNVVIFIFFQGW